MPAACSIALVRTTLKSLASQATLRHCSGKVSINTELLAELRPGLKKKLKAHASGFIRQLPDF